MPELPMTSNGALIPLDDLKAPAWGTPGWPEKFSALRPHQYTAIEAIVSAFTGGARVVVLDAPTGSGKTAVAEAVRRILNVPSTYVCIDKGLQAQVLRDFPYARPLMGRSNYPTLNYPDRFNAERYEDALSADDCQLRGQGEERACPFCDPHTHCPYRIAKREALRAPLSCLNTAYFLTEANGPGGFSGRQLIVVDEADRLEDALLNAAEGKVSARQIKDWGLTFLTEDVNNDDAAAWLTDQVLPKLKRELGHYDPETEEDVRRNRAYRRLLAQYERLLDTADDLRDQLAVTIVAPSDGTVTFKPITITHLADTRLWAHGHRWLLMSATMLGAKTMLADLGAPGPWAEVHMPSSFPVETRPIYSVPVASVTRTNEARAVVALTGALRKILDRHPQDRILIHTVSYRLTGLLKERFADARCLWYQDAAQRVDIINRYLKTPGAVLIAPAMERGLDLPDDACRCVVVCKMPWANLGDRQVAARLKWTPGGQAWYSLQALRTVIQATGRGVRHDQDHCVTYLLDEEFLRLANRYWTSLPEWWRDALVMNHEL